MATRVLAVDDNPINLKVVSISLRNAGFEVYTAENGPQALEAAAAIVPEIILLDISMPDMDGYEVCRRLRGNSRTAGIGIMMLTSHDTLEEKIKGFESGADDYLTKPFQPAELQARIKGLMRRTTQSNIRVGTPTSFGKVIGVFSLRGGTGVTTIATNLAGGLAQVWGTQVALVDLSLTLGQAALMLNLSLRNTWADLTNIPPQEIDAELVQNVLLSHPTGVSVLAAPRQVADGELVTPELVRKVIEILRERFDYVILDFPHDFRETTLAGLDFCDEVVALLAPELASVRAMGGALEVFDTLKYSRDKVVLTLNWIFERKGLARKDIENVLRKPIQVVIPFAPEVFVTAINFGAPPVCNAPATPIGSLFEDVAYSLSREVDLQSQPKNPSDALLRVLSREENRLSGKR